MAVTAKVSMQTILGGMVISSIVEKSDELEQAFRTTMDAGIAGTLSTRTDVDTGVLTVETGHGITDADTVSVFFDDGSRYGMTVSSTTATTISVDLGTGDDFPAEASEIVVSVEAEHDIPITGDNLIVLAIGCSNRSSIEFLSAAPASLLRYDMVAKEGRNWVKGMDVTNPLAGDTVASILLANGGTTAAQFSVATLVNTN